MKTESLSVGRAGYVPVRLGKIGEAQATRIDIDVREWDETYPGATYLLFVSPPEPTAPYLAKVTHENGVVSWVLESEDTTTAGNGTIELILTQGNVRIKSVTWSTMMMTSPSSSKAGDAPQSHPTWWEDALDKIEDAKQEAISEIDGTFDSEVAEGKAALEASGAAQQEAIENKGKNTLDSIPEDYTALANDVSTLKDHKAPAIEVEASGSLITIDDAAAMPVHGLVSQIVPVQSGSGDPSPKNERPIIGWNTVSATRTGKNLADDSVLANSSICVWDETEQAWRFDALSDSNSPVFYTNNGTPGVITLAYDIMHTDEGDGDTAIVRIRYTDGTSSKSVSSVSKPNTWRRVVLTSDSSKTVRDVSYNYHFGLSRHPGYLKNIMVNAGDTALPYVPYDGQTLSADLPETVYGGKPDWTNGVLTVTHARFRLSPNASDWDTYMVNENTETLFSFRTKSAFSNYSGGSLCTCFAPGPATGRDPIPNIYSFHSTNKRLYVKVEIDDVTTVETFAQWLADNPQYIVYKLAEPYTIQLTPQRLDMLRGLNNVWSDCGDTSLVYVADTKMYIDKQIAAAVALALNG